MEKKYSNRTRKNEFKIFLNDIEAKKLLSDCKRSGLTKSALIRKRVMEFEVKTPPQLDLIKLNSELNRIGVNLNQIALALHTQEQVFSSQVVNQLNELILAHKKIQQEVLSKL